MRLLLVPAATIAKDLDAIARELRDAGIEVTIADSAILETPEASQFDLIAGPGSMRIDAALMDRAVRLRGIVSVGTGCEGFDLIAARERGIAVARGSTAGAASGMASAVIMLMLALCHDLPGAIAAMQNGNRREVAHARSLDGATVGIIGYGSIGREVARRLRAWDVKVLAASPSLGVGTLSNGVDGVSLECLLKTSDVVSLHASLTPQTAMLLDRERIAWMKPGALLVNTARGGLVDEVALSEALHERRIGGAALDCFSHEPLPMDHALRTAPNTILTPHQIGHTIAGTQVLVRTFVENILSLARIVRAGQNSPTGDLVATVQGKSR